MISKKLSKSVLKAGLNAAIFGPTGYTGHEIIRLLLKHPKVKIKLLIGNKNKDKYISEIFTTFSNNKLPKIQDLKNANFSNIDVVFSCMPSGSLDSIIHLIPKDLVIIDLSADYRIKDIKLFEKYYAKHLNSKYLKKFTYGLTEFNRKKIKVSRYIACPGCYPTSILIPILPLIKKNIVSINEIIVDSKSGISGAGRNIKQDLIFAENYNSFKAYGGGNHRHIPEIENYIYEQTTKKVNIIFTPHLIPINRGILSTIYLKGNALLIQKTLKDYYSKESFVNINNLGELPKISDVIGSNLCKVGVLQHYRKNYVIIISVIDNLIKGASGQAVQNMNLIFNMPEELGLDHHPIWP
tara:strand:+ start:1165 stop:2223 length:1059 start_codon:yes stop_codon:yes gene_type:complete